MPVNFTCPICGQLLAVEAQPGQLATCGACGSAVTVPAATAPPSPPAGSSPTGPAANDLTLNRPRYGCAYTVCLYLASAWAAMTVVVYQFLTALAREGGDAEFLIAV